MKQNRTILGACEYSIATLQGIKKSLMDYGHPNQDITWAVGGLIVTLSSHLLKLCNEIFLDVAKTGDPNAKDDIREIQDKFNAFIDGMLAADK